jgi:hypothetical protein
MPGLAMFVARGVLPSAERSDYVYQHLLRPHHDLMLPIIREAISAGVIRQQDPELFFFLFVTSVSMTIAIQPRAVTANVLGNKPATPLDRWPRAHQINACRICTAKDLRGAFHAR